MANAAKGSDSTRTIIILLIVLVLGLAGFGVWKFNQPAPDSQAAATADHEVADQEAADQKVAGQDTAAADAAATQPAAADAVAEAPAAAADNAAASAPRAASFDVVRIAPDGTATIAGQAEPGATIVLMVDQAEVARAEVGADGKFATVFTLSPSSDPRMLVTRQTLADGTEVPGGASVAIDPILAPTIVAEAPRTTDGTADGTADVAPAPETATSGEAQSEAPGAVIVADTGIKVAQSAASGPAVLGAIAYDAAGALHLAGTGIAGDTLQVFADSDMVDQVPIGADGSWISRPEIAPGVYTLRLVELDPSGKIVGSFETPFKREAPEALQAAGGQVTVADTGAASPEATAPATEQAPAEGTATAQAEAQPADGAGTAAPETTAVETTAPETTAPEAAAPEAAAEAAQATSTPPAASTPAVTVTVQPGFTLWGIARKTMGQGILYVQIFKANKDLIRNPDLIYPGQVFVIPKE